MPDKRFAEIDILCAFALILMLFSNFLTDLSIFGIAEYPFNFWLARITAFLFVFVSGISLHLSYENAKKQGKLRFGKFLKRGVFLFSLGLLITLSTFIFLKEGTVLFGILHLLGISAILGYFLLKLDERQAFAVSTIVFLAGFFLSGMRFQFPWLLWLGFIPNNFVSLDYEPLLPWFSFFALGITFGKVFYPKLRRSFRFPRMNLPMADYFSKAVSFLGRHTLAFYLIHQPVFVAVISLLFSEKVFALLRLPF